MTDPDWTKRYPDHREGIAGVDLSGGMLDFDNDATITLVASLCRYLRSALLVGNPAPIVADMAARLTAPVVGDLVIEVSAMNPRASIDTRWKGFGFLIAQRTEWFDSAAAWATFAAQDPEYATEDNRSLDEAWYIQYGPGPNQVCRWTNCQFMTVPADLMMFQEVLTSG